MYDTPFQAVLTRPDRNEARKQAKSPRRDFIDILRDEIARGEYLTEERISRTVDVLAPILMQDHSEKGAA